MISGCEGYFSLHMWRRKLETTLFTVRLDCTASGTREAVEFGRLHVSRPNHLPIRYTKILSRYRIPLSMFLLPRYSSTLRIQRIDCFPGQRALALAPSRLTVPPTKPDDLAISCICNVRSHTDSEPPEMVSTRISQ